MPVDHSLEGRREAAKRANAKARARQDGDDVSGIAPPPGPPHDGGMDGISDLKERVEHLETRFDALSKQLRGDRNAIIGTIIASVLAVVTLLYAAQANMLSAFQAGLSAVQASSSAAQPQPPMIIQLPAPVAAPPVATSPPPTQP